MTNFDLWEQFKFSFICYSYQYENNYFQACVIKSFNGSSIVYIVHLSFSNVALLNILRECASII